MTEPQVGIHPDVSFDDYCDWDAINHSKLCRIDKSPLHCQHAPSFEKSQAIRLGQLVHCGRLESSALHERYAVMPAYELMPENTTKDGSPSRSTATAFVRDSQRAFKTRAINEKKTIISEAEWTQYVNTMDAIEDCPEAVDLLTGAETELSIVWHDEATGLKCKARIDIRKPDRLGDLKTSRDDKASPLPVSFEYSMWQYNYYSQAAFYQSGWEALTGERLPFWFCVVGTDSPMQCVAAPVGEMTLQAGREKNAERLALYSECKRAGVFPGYTSPVIFELPERYLESELTI